MYKKVKKYAESIGFTVEEKAGLAYGQLNGVFVSIRQNPASPACHTVQLWVKQGSMEPVPAIVDFVNQCSLKFQYLRSASYSGSQITAQFQAIGFKWSSKYVPCLDAFLKEITLYCSSNGLVHCCEVCQTEQNLSLYQVDDSNLVLCPVCYADLTQNIQRRMDRSRREGNGNIAGGIVGALLGGMIGIAVWVLIYQLGYISGLAGLVMVVCAFKGYELLGDRINKVGITLCILLSLLMVPLAEQLSLAIEIYNALKHDYGISFFYAFRSSLWIPGF